MKSSREASAVPSKSVSTTRRPVLRALVGLGALGVLGAVPVAAASTAPAGSGTELDPYRITTVPELQWIGTDGPLDSHYVVVNDIDASTTAMWDNGAGFIAIGTFLNGFRGSFDGQGHTISGLVIDRPTQSLVGLFGEVEAGAMVESVRLTTVNITGKD